MTVKIFFAGILVWLSQNFYISYVSYPRETFSGNFLLPSYFKYIGAGMLLVLIFLPAEFSVHQYLFDNTFRDLVIIISMLFIAGSSESNHSSSLTRFRYFTLMSSIAAMAIISFIGTLLIEQPKGEPDGLRLLSATLFLYVVSFHLSKRKLIARRKVWQTKD